jgi:hypothetical protein
MGELHQLINANVQADDVGKYSCVAENEAGVATCVAKVKLFGKKMFKNVNENLCKLTVFECAEPIKPADEKQSDRLTESEFLTRKAVFTQSNTVFSVTESGSKNVHKVTREVEHTVKQVSGQEPEEVIRFE